VRALTLVLAAALLVGCADRADTNGAASFADVTDNPDDYDDQRITVTSGYYAAREIGVLTSGFAESYPPQPVEPLIWVGTGPSGACLEQDQGVAWAERVQASGVFRYDPQDGFGHLGGYEMALEDATITCA
jgi:hypothetical protein